MIVVIFHCLLISNVFHNANYQQDYPNVYWKLLFITPLHTFFAGLPAVLLFFILSGFVLSLPFLKKIAPSYLNYIIKRFCRIYLPFIVIVFVSVILVKLFATYEDIDWLSPIYNSRWDHPVTLQALISYVLMISYDMTNVNGVIWTLFHEMRISLFFPLLIYPIIKYNWKRAMVISIGSIGGVWIFFRVLIALLDNKYIQLLLYEFSDTLYYTCFFIIGAFLAKYRHIICTRIRKFNTTTLTIVLLLSILLINYKWLYEIYNIDNFNFSGYYLIRDFIPSLGIVLLFSLVLAVPRLGRGLTKRPLIWLGKISYSLCLVHIPIIMISSIYLSKLIPVSISVSLAPLLSLPVAALTYRWIELPSIHLGKKLTFKMKNKESVVTKIIKKAG
ncbi:acyltransferase family protein [Candidatus Pristimantibacillus sp. PTI5]|uniref:acyltransferase family protein n=1 Tax=Candidatus Pristimantibacillus sp. PTI5 TaxID=3400422 RepID=UPI003B02496D